MARHRRRPIGTGQLQQVPAVSSRTVCQLCVLRTTWAAPDARQLDEPPVACTACHEQTASTRDRFIKRNYLAMNNEQLNIGAAGLCLCLTVAMGDWVGVVRPEPDRRDRAAVWVQRAARDVAAVEIGLTIVLPVDRGRDSAEGAEMCSPGRRADGEHQEQHRCRHRHQGVYGGGKYADSATHGVLSRGARRGAQQLLVGGETNYDELPS